MLPGAPSAKASLLILCTLMERSGDWDALKAQETITSLCSVSTSPRMDEGRLLALAGVASELRTFDDGNSLFGGDCIKVGFAGDFKGLIADCVKMELSRAPLFGD